MAEYLQVEPHKITLFCQVNGITPYQDDSVKRRLKKDDYHIWHPRNKIGRPYPAPETENRERLPGIYSNRSRTDIINYYENL